MSLSVQLGGTRPNHSVREPTRKISEHLCLFYYVLNDNAYLAHDRPSVALEIRCVCAPSRVTSPPRWCVHAPSVGALFRVPSRVRGRPSVVDDATRMGASGYFLVYASPTMMWSSCRDDCDRCCWRRRHRRVRFAPRSAHYCCHHPHLFHCVYHRSHRRHHGFASVHAFVTSRRDPCIIWSLILNGDIWELSDLKVKSISLKAKLEIV